MTISPWMEYALRLLAHYPDSRILGGPWSCALRLKDGAWKSIRVCMNTVSALQRRGFVIQEVPTPPGQTRWAITEEGRAAIAAIMEDECPE